MEEILVIRNAMLDKDAQVPSTKNLKNLLEIMFPYLPEARKAKISEAKRIMEEDMESILLVSPIEKKRK